MTLAPRMRDMNRRCFTNGAVLLLMLLTLGSGLVRAANDQARAPSISKATYHRVNIPALNAAEALNQLAEQTKALFMFPYDTAKSRQAHAVSGRYTIMEALDIILQGSGLAADLSQKGVIEIYHSDKAFNKNDGRKVMNSRKKILAATIGFFMGAGMVPGVMGQEGKSVDAETAWLLEEIVVTATKRKTSLQDTAVSISALSGDVLGKKNLVGMGDYLATIPGVSQADFGVGQNRLSMRGIAASFSDETTVGVFLGEVPLNNIGGGGGAVDIKLVDMDRVEILRGPQGTLYGSGSMGGAVRNIPNAPDSREFDAELQLGGSHSDGASDLDYKVTAALNIPLIQDQLALRVAAYQFDNQGYVDNQAENNPLVANATALGGVLNRSSAAGGNEFTGMRASLRWQPTEQLSFTLMHVMQELEQDGVRIVTEEGEYKNTRLSLNDRFSQTHEQRWDEVDVTNLVVEYSFDWGDLLSSTTVSDGHYGQLKDMTEIVGGLPAGMLDEYDSDGFVQEIRFNSQLAGPIQFLGGAYYEDLQRKELTSVVWTGDDSLNFFGTPVLFGGPQNSDIEQLALFGELSYDITEQFKLTLGGRWFEYDRKEFQALTGPFAGAGIFVDKEGSENGAKGKVNLAYTPNENMLIYALWAQGFRLGKPVAAPPQALCDVAPQDGILDGTNTRINTSGALESDNLDSFELGGKFTLLEDRLVVNAAVYHINWEGIPIRVNGSCNIPTEVNAGEARSRGMEVETQLQLSERLRLEFGASYIDAELSRDAEGLGAKGDRLPYTPRVNANIGFDYGFTLGGYDAFVHGNYAYVGGSYTDLAQSSVEMGDYGKLSLRTGMVINDNLNVELYGTNLTNRDEFVYFGNDIEYYQLSPRQIGLDIRYQF